MTQTPKTTITTTKQLGSSCPACGNPLLLEIQLELEPTPEGITYDPYDGDHSYAGQRQAQVQLLAAVKGARINHDCINPAKRGPGRPRKDQLVARPGSEVKTEVKDEPIAKSNAQEHRDRLREHEVTSA